MPFGAETDATALRVSPVGPPQQKSELVARTAETPRRIDAYGGRLVRACHRKAPAGTRYHYQIDGRLDVPDPASRFQPGRRARRRASDRSARYDWRDSDWRGPALGRNRPLRAPRRHASRRRAPSRGVERRLDHLADARRHRDRAHAGRRLPGRAQLGLRRRAALAPDAALRHARTTCKRLVDAAHAPRPDGVPRRGLQPLRPRRQLSARYAPQFFTERHQTPWGAAINFDGPRRAAVRDFFMDNALYWLEEFHFDGLRFDAVHAIVDDSDAAYPRRARGRRARGPRRDRHVHLVLENGATRRAASCATPSGARAYNAQWNDDFHHAAARRCSPASATATTPTTPTTPQHCLGRSLAEGFAYQGEPVSASGGDPRGEPSAAPAAGRLRRLPPEPRPDRQPRARRAHRRAARAKRAAGGYGALLLRPSPPMLFMGEELARDRRRFCFSAISGPSSPTPCAKAAAGSSRASSASARRRGSDPGSERRGHVRARASSTGLRHDAPEALGMAGALQDAPRACGAARRSHRESNGMTGGAKAGRMSRHGRDSA